jgi:type IV pilus assembly protein PilW
MNRKGMTLIELLVVLVVSGILVAGVYRTFISQQHTFTVQEQVVDMQQNVRLAINRMTRELRMAGYGCTDGTVLGSGGVNGFTNIVTPGGDNVTVVIGFQTLIPTTLSAYAAANSNSIFVNDVSGFDTGARKYISINGLESHRIGSIVGKEIRFPSNKLKEEHWPGEPVYLVMAITYSIGPFEGKSCLLRDDHLGLVPPQPVAENIDNLQFAYFDANGNPTANPPDIRMIQVNLVARTDRTDPQLAKVSDGFRRRNLTSNIQLRNLSFL